MKIISVGKIQEKEETKKCQKCNTKFSFVKADVESDRDGFYVKCPHCNTFIAV